MKRLIASLLISLSSLGSIWACAPFYPFGDEVRFGLLSLEKLGLNEYSPFNYTWNNWYWRNDSGIDEIEAIGRQINAELWAKKYNYSGDLKEVLAVVYSDKTTDVENFPSNHFVKLIIEQNDFEAIKYLDFAKSCQQLNSIYSDDPWERGRDINDFRSKFITEALNRSKASKDADLERRYAFIALRLAFYSSGFFNDRHVEIDQIKAIYNDHFSKEKLVDIIDYWALYYCAKLLPKGPKQNFLLSKSFYGAIDKRVAISREFSRDVPIDSTLNYAKTDLEKANIMLVYKARKLDHAKDEIIAMHKLAPSFKGTEFLLVRELAKLEDWILTPYYTNFSPAISSPFYDRDDELTYNTVKKDMHYTRQLLTFVKGVNKEKVNNASVWYLAEAYLHYMLKEFDNTLAISGKFFELGIDKRNRVSVQFELIKTLSEVAIDDGERAISTYFKTIVLKQSEEKNNRFLFAMARELEFNGNTTDAAIILSKLDNSWSYKHSPVFWRTDNKHHTLYSDFYDDYFFYLDANYSPKQVKQLIVSIEDNHDDLGSDKQYTAHFDKNEINRLKDLLGTKYFRANRLNEANTAFASVASDYWSDKWQYEAYLDANPFYTNFANEHGRTDADTVKYNKAQILEKLVYHLQSANNPQNTERAYHYFVAANCYLNTSHHGNSWILRRFFWTRNIHKSGLPDDNEFFECNTAKKLYLKASELAKTRDFKALSIRLAGRCKDYEIRYSDLDNITYLDWNDRFGKNPYYQQFKTEYSAYYEDFFEICYSFDRYFENR